MVAEYEPIDGGAIVFRVPYRRSWVDAVKRAVPSAASEVYQLGPVLCDPSEDPFCGEGDS